MNVNSNEPSLIDVLHDMWRAKLWVLGGAVVVILLAFVFVMLSEAKYKAMMIVAPADGYALGDYASSTNYERMASLPFWRPSDPEGVSTDYYRFIHTLRGSSVAEILMKDQSVLSQLKEDGVKNLSREKLAAYLQKQVKVEPLGATPLRQIQYYHADQDFAAAFLRKIHLVSDQLIRRDRRRQSQSRVEYLQKSMADTNHPDHRKIIANLLMQQEHVQMLANLDEPYAAIVVEPAATGPKPDWPNVKLIYPIAFFLGAFLGYLIWLVRLPRHG